MIRIRYYYLLSLLILLNSCAKQNQHLNKKENVYEVVKFLYDDAVTSHLKIVALPQPIAPASGSNISRDSILKMIKEFRKVPKDTFSLINNRIRKFGRYIVAIDSVLKPPYPLDINEKSLKDCLIDNEFKSIYNDFKSLRDTVSINVNEIENNEYSYIIPYQDYFRKLPRRGFDKYDILLGFSNIQFNDTYTKAIIISSVAFDRLNGFGEIIFLEKKKSQWTIKCREGLYIS